MTKSARTGVTTLQFAIDGIKYRFFLSPGVTDITLDEVKEHIARRIVRANGDESKLCGKNLIIEFDLSLGEKDTRIRSGLEVEDGVVIHAGAYLSTDVKLGRKVEIGSGCKISSNVKVRDGAKVGSNNFLPDFVDVDTDVVIPDDLFPVMGPESTRLQSMSHVSQTTVDRAVDFLKHSATSPLERGSLP